MFGDTEELSTAEAAYFEHKGDVPETPPENVEEKPETPPETPEPPEEIEEKDGKITLVPHAALHQERLKNKELASTIAQQREQLAQFNGRLDQLTKQFRGDKPEEQKPLTEADRLEQLERVLGERVQQEQTHIQKQQFLTAYQQDAQSYAQENKDFFDAYTFVVSQRRAVYEAMGHQDKGQIDALLENEEMNFVNQALRNGVRPPQALYDMAKRLGYQGKIEEKKPDNSAEKTLAVVASGQKVAKTLAKTGASNDTEMSVEEMLKLSDDEFETLTKGDKFRKLAGG